MKKAKALLSLLLVAAMLCSMLTPAFAAAPEPVSTSAVEEAVTDTEAVSKEAPQDVLPDATIEPTTEDASKPEDVIPAELIQPTESSVPSETASEETPADEELTTETPTAEEPSAEEPTPSTEGVAKIGDTTYATLDEAVKAAENGAVIEVLADCTTDGLNLSKDLTIRAAADLSAKPTITFVKDGIALWAKSLTFEGCNIEMSHIGSTPYAEWRWMAICGQAGSALNLIDTTMSMDGQDLPSNTHAIYADNGMKLFMDHSKLSITHYPQDALEWNGGKFDYNVEMIDSTYLSDHNRSGFTGSFNVKATRSMIDVINSTGNGSNGSNFHFIDSDVNFSDNGSHGLSAGALTVENSNISAYHNGLCGIAVSAAGDLLVDGTSTLTIARNCYKTWTASSALRMYGGKRKALIQSGAKVIIHDNEASGMETYRPTVIEDGVSLTIVNNRILRNDSNGTDGMGGGIYTYRTLTLPSDAVIYNNHALTCGDDIYCNPEEGQITFGKVGTDWALDGAPDCEHAIDGWYDDSVGARWSAHKKPVHTEVFHEDEFVETTGLATVKGELCLKAAHKVSALPPVNPDQPDAPSWEVSKSKSATALDDNFESRVTLSLPSAEQELVSDVVLVVDYSSCQNKTIQETQALLEQLMQQAERTGAKINIGTVLCRGAIRTYPESTNYALAPLNEESVNGITQMLRSSFFLSRGSNLSSGLLAGEKMLDQDTTTDNNRKYLIAISDGITFLWDDDTTAEPESLCANFSNADLPNRAMWAGPDAWDVAHGAHFVPENWNTHFDLNKINATKQDKAVTYPKYSLHRPAVNPDDPFVRPADLEQYASSVDVALYQAMTAYQRIESKYHAFSVCRAEQKDADNFPYGPSFMKFLAHGEEVTFDQIQNDICYLLDAGSTVEDVIGYGKDNKGNDYNMDFVADASKLNLTVGETALTAEAVEIEPDAFFTEHKFETARFGFGKNENDSYDYVVHYYANGKDGHSDECFVWDINVPVSNFAPVQLTYSVKLTNPQTVEGTYGEYDQFGTNHKDALYTNESATLFPVDSNGQAGVPELFEKPTVSYTVAAAPTPTPVDPTPTPVDPTPVDPTPAPTPDVKPEPTPAPAPTAAPTAAPQHNSGNGANTGDTTNMNLWFSLMTLCAMGAAGAWVISKKSR